MMRLSIVLIVILTLSGIASARTWTVNPGQSIQETLDKAEPGDTVQVLPGQFAESIRIEKENLRVVGMSYEGERCELLGEYLHRVGITVEADGVTVEGFVLREFSEKGLAAGNVSDLTVSGVRIFACGDINIDLQKVTRGEIINCEVRGAERHGLRLYRGQELTIADGAFSDADIGIYVYESAQTTIESNAIFDNSVGIRIEGAGLEEHPAEHTKILHNRIVRNNRVNESSTNLGPTTRALGISGFGIEVSNADHTEIAYNRIEENGSTGISVRDHFSARDWTELPDKTKNHLKRPTEPRHLSDHTNVHNNTFAHNGQSESLLTVDQIPKGDIYFDGKGEQNTFPET